MRSMRSINRRVSRQICDSAPGWGSGHDLNTFAVRRPQFLKNLGNSRSACSSMCTIVNSTAMYVEPAHAMSIQLDDFLHAFSWLFTIALIAATLGALFG